MLGTHLRDECGELLISMIGQWNGASLQCIVVRSVPVLAMLAMLALAKLHECSPCRRVGTLGGWCYIDCCAI